MGQIGFPSVVSDRHNTGARLVISDAILVKLSLSFLFIHYQFKKTLTSMKKKHSGRVQKLYVSNEYDSHATTDVMCSTVG